MSTHTHSDRPTGRSRKLIVSVAYLSAIALFGFALAVFLLLKDRSANAVGAFVGVTWAVPVAALAITIAAVLTIRTAIRHLRLGLDTR